MTVIDWGSLIQQAATAAAALPVGDYNMVITDVEYKIAGTGKPMYVAKMRVEDGPHQGRAVNNNFVLVADNPNALRMFFRNMNALGLDANFFAANPTPEAVASALVNRRARVSLAVKPYMGEDRNEVKSIGPAQGAANPANQVLGGGAPAAAPVAAAPQPAAPAPVAPAAPAPAPAPEPAAAAPAPAPAPAPEPQYYTDPNTGQITHVLNTATNQWDPLPPQAPPAPAAPAAPTAPAAPEQPAAPAAPVAQVIPLPVQQPQATPGAVPPLPI